MKCFFTLIVSSFFSFYFLMAFLLIQTLSKWYTATVWFISFFCLFLRTDPIGGQKIKECRECCLRVWMSVLTAAAPPIVVVGAGFNVFICFALLDFSHHFFQLVKHSLNSSNFLCTFDTFRTSFKLCRFNVLPPNDQASGSLFANEYSLAVRKKIAKFLYLFSHLNLQFSY